MKWYPLLTMTKKVKLLWRVDQPPINEEIVIFVNHAKPSYHVVRWAHNPTIQFYNNDWDIKLSHGVYVGPRHFEGGCQFIEDINDKEFMWASKEDFLKFSMKKQG